MSGHRDSRSDSTAPVGFVGEEIDAVLLGLTILAANEEDEMAEAAEAARRRVLAALPPVRRPRRATDASLRGVIRAALKTEESLRLRYRDGQGATTERTVWPILLLGDEMLAAWCETRRDFRHFRLDRMTEAAATGDATARALFYRMRDPEGIIFPDRRWKFAFVGGYRFERQPGVPNLNARSFYFFAATGVTPAMDTKVVGEGSTYPWTAEDSNGNAFDGGKTYRLRLPGPVPVKTFWSTIVYDTQTRSMLQTDNRFPSVSSQKPDLQVNADRSVDVWFGPTAPAGKESNWVQTIPGKSWFVILRLYGPLQPWFDKTWKPGDIELQG